jgi:hypothetical protein
MTGAAMTLLPRNPDQKVTGTFAIPGVLLA